MKAVVAGVTGLIGSAVSRLLAADPQFTEVLLLARRPSTEKWPPHIEWRVVDFDAADTYAKLGAPDVVFSCFGTTRKQSSNEASYRKVDFEYPMAIAKATPQAHYLVVTAVGANAGSRMFYTRLKGELEDSLRALHLPALDIFQPGMLLGRRDGERAYENVLGTVFRGIDLALVGPLKKYHSISGEQVAKAMIQAAKTQQSGIRVHTYADMAISSES